MSAERARKFFAGIGVSLLALLVAVGFELWREGPSGLRLVAECGRARPAKTPESRIPWAFAVSADGRFAFLEEGNDALGLVDVATLGSARICPRRAPRYSGRYRDLSWGPAVFSPDGAFVVYGQANDLIDNQGFLRWDLRSDAVDVFDRYHREVRHDLLSLSADGQLLLSSLQFGRVLTLWDTTTRKQVRRFERFDFADDIHAPEGDARAEGVALLPDGKRALSLHGKRVAEWDVATGKRTRIFPASATELRCFAVSPDGRWILTGDAAGKLERIDLASGAPLEATKLSDGAIYAIEVSSATDEDVAALAITVDARVHLVGLSPLRELAATPPGPVPTQAHFRAGTREVLVSRGPGSLERWSYARVR